MSSNQPATTAYVVDDYTELRQMMREAQTIRDFLAIYDSPQYQAALRRLRQAATSEIDVWAWAKAWAIRMRNEDMDEQAVAWNQDRGVCLLQLYEICDRVSHGVLTEHDVVEGYSGHRVVNVLQYCLPMDRAQALYKMQYPGATKLGMHWIAKQQLTEEWKKILGDGRPTLNKRILMLINMKGLGLQENKVFRKWTEPTRCDTLGEE